MQPGALKIPPDSTMAGESREMRKETRGQFDKCHVLLSLFNHDPMAFCLINEWSS